MCCLHNGRKILTDPMLIFGILDIDFDNQDVSNESRRSHQVNASTQFVRGIHEPKGRMQMQLTTLDSSVAEATSRGVVPKPSGKRVDSQVSILLWKHSIPTQSANQIDLGGHQAMAQKRV